MLGKEVRENQNNEFKESWRDEYIKWICGFANAEGGELFIGVDDSAKVVGIENAKKLLEDIPNKVRDILGVIVDVNLLNDDGLEYLQIITEAYPSPVSYKGQYHYRTGSTKQELKGQALDRFLLRKYGRTWDSVPLPYVTVDDLDKDTFEFFIKKAINSKRLEPKDIPANYQELLEKLRLIEGSYLRRSAVLLFHKEPERFFTGCYVKIGYFESESTILYQPDNWTIATLLKEHRSEPFNPDLASAFFRAGYIESWGRGINTVIELSKAYNGTVPTFEFLGGLTVEFGSNYPNKKVGNRLYAGLYDRVYDNLGETRVKIIEIINKNAKISMTQLADELSMSRTAIQKNIEFLKVNGYIKRVGSAKGGHWEVLNANNIENL